MLLCYYLRELTMYRLLFQDRRDYREPVVISESSLVIGRDPTCQLCLSEKGVEDRHAEIRREDDGYYICDLGGAIGVRVNGVRAARKRLQSGDELELGSVQLRFEIVHGKTRSSHRPVDMMQAIAVAVVVLVIAGQLLLYGVIFSERRPKGMRTDTGRLARAEDPVIGSADPKPLPSMAGDAQMAGSVPSVPQVRADPALAAQNVLGRMIRIARADRTDGNDSVTVNFQVKAQVGERTLDVSATAICVQFAALDAAGRSVSWREPVWLRIPSWENFTTKGFVARFPEAPGQLVGFVVRTYYRNQLQDMTAIPPSLRALAPNPLP